MRNRINLHTIRDDTLLDTLKFVSKTQDYHQYGALIPEEMINQDIKDSKSYKTYLAFATGQVTPKKERKFKKIDSPSKKLSPVLEEEPANKPKLAKKPTKKSTTVPTASVVISDTPGVSVSKKKAPANVDRGKGMDLLSDVALLEAAQLKKVLKKSKQDTHMLHASGSSDGVSSQPKVSDESQENTTGTNEGIVHVNYFINNDLEYLRGGSSSGKYTTYTTKNKAAKYDNNQGIEDMVPSLWSPVKNIYVRYVVWEITHWGPKRQRFNGLASNRVSKHGVYSSKRIIAVTHVKVMMCYDYSDLEEIEVRTEDQKLYKFKEGDFPRLNLRDIEDIPVVILKWVKDLQLGVESYQKKLNITKPQTFKSVISNRIPYTAYSNPQGIIYVEKYKRNRLMRSDELYKFSDGTLTSVRSVLHDIASNLRIDYFPKRR
nr:hypothetical protein [Tanacetum cinerariifolium]